MKRRLIAITLVLTCILSLSLTGCGGSERESAKNNELNVALSAKFPSLDPNSYPSDISRLVMENLLEVNYKDSKLEPGIAESWNVSSDGLVWDFKIRKDVTFHNGEPVTVEDVLYSANLCADSPSGYGYENAKFEIISDDEFRITYPDYTNLRIYDAVIPIVDADQFKKLGDNAYWEQLIGTGPYKLESYDSATGVAKLVKNDKYWGEAGKLDKITFRVISDVTSGLIALQKGEIDFAQIDSSIYSSVEKDENLETAFSIPCLANILVFNTQEKPTNDKRFRQAVNLAIDRDLVAQAGEIKGNYEVADAFYASVWGDKPKGLSAYEFNPEKAKKLLKDMGVKTPVDLGKVSILSEQKSMMEIVKQNLEDVGIKIELETLDSVAHLDNLKGNSFKLGVTQPMDVNSAPVWTFYSFFNSGLNYAKCNDANMDKLADSVYTDTDQAKVAKSEAELMRIATDESLYGMMYLKGRPFAFAKGLKADMSDTRNRHFENFYWE